MTKVIGICGSPRAGGNTEQLLKVCLDKIAESSIETELITLHGKNVNGCIACMRCRESLDGRCHGHEDDITPLIPKIIEADGLIVGSPVYFGTPTPEILAFLHRLGYVSRGNGGLLKNKVGASLAVARHAGQNFTLATMNFFFYINEMIQPGSSYWNVAFGREEGEVMNDTEGLDTIRRTADNIVEMLGILGKKG